MINLARADQHGSIKTKKTNSERLSVQNSLVARFAEAGKQRMFVPC